MEVIKVGNKYFAIKPIDIDNEEHFLKEEVSADKSRYFVENKVSLLLKQIQMPAKLKGFRFLKDAVTLLIENDRTAGNMKNNIYMKIAEKYDTSYYNVERNIRHAIDRTWIDDNASAWEFSSKKPSSAALIAILAENVILERDVF